MAEQFSGVAIELSTVQNDIVTASCRGLFSNTPLEGVSNGATGLWGARLISEPLDEFCRGMRLPTRRHIEEHFLRAYSPRYKYDTLFKRDMQDYGVVYMPGDFAMGIQRAQRTVELEDHGEIALDIVQVVASGSAHVRIPFPLEGRALVVSGKGENVAFGGLYRSRGRQLYLGAEKMDSEQREAAAGAFCGLIRAAVAQPYGAEAAS